MSQLDTDTACVTRAPGGSEALAGEGKPGALRGSVTLTLETRQAQRLVKGRPGTAGRPAIIGLIGFASLLRAIWQGAMADDPYADWWLVKIHAALDEADKAIQASLGSMQQGLEASEAISVTPGASVRPSRTLLRFSNPYAHRGARLLGAYDGLVRAVLTARHIGAMTREEAEPVLALGGRQLRRAFLSPLGYRLTGVTRADVVQGTALYAQAQARMGEVPATILSGELRAPHAPVGPLPTSRLAQHLETQAQSPTP